MVCKRIDIFVLYVWREKNNIICLAAERKKITVVWREESFRSHNNLVHEKKWRKILPMFVIRCYHRRLVDITTKKSFVFFQCNYYLIEKERKSSVNRFFCLKLDWNVTILIEFNQKELTIISVNDRRWQKSTLYTVL